MIGTRGFSSLLEPDGPNPSLHREDGLFEARPADDVERTDAQARGDVRGVVEEVARCLHALGDPDGQTISFSVDADELRSERLDVARVLHQGHDRVLERLRVALSIRGSEGGESFVELLQGEPFVDLRMLHEVASVPAPLGGGVLAARDPVLVGELERRARLGEPLPCAIETFSTVRDRGFELGTG